MNENINLCEILKGLEGIELYSTIFGVVKLTKIDSFNSEYPIEFENDQMSCGTVTIDGKYYNGTKGECTLFPSKDQRDWSKFERPIPIDTPMMFAVHATGRWRLGYYFGKSQNLGYHVCYAEGKTSKSHAPYTAENFYPYMIPFDKFNPNDIEESLEYNIQK